jgi:competence protein ComEC
MILTAINPLTVWDVGFQLSFMATLGLVLYVDPLQKAFAKLLERIAPADTAKQIMGAISDSVLVTIAAQIMTAPIMVYHFERFSTVSLPVNLLIVPVQSYIMILGGVGVLLAMIIWPIGQLLAWGSWLLLAYTVRVVQFGASLPGASVPIGPISPLTVAALYALIFGMTWLRSQPPEERVKWQSTFAGALSAKFALFGGGLVAALLFTTAASMPDGRLHVTFLDLGDGTATLIETPSGRHILVDAGGSGRGLSTALGRELPFWDRSIDLLVVTQPTRSHLSGLLQILERYNFEAVLTNGAPGDSEVAGAVWGELTADGTLVLTAEPGMAIAIEDGLQLNVLAGNSGVVEDASDPGTPVVVMLVYRDARILLTGDLSTEHETQLLGSDEPIHATVLQVPRGGHRDASSEAFLKAVDPQVVVLAVGAGNRAGVPHPETIDRLQAMGAMVYRTDLQSNIRINTDGQQLWVETDW